MCKTKKAVILAAVMLISLICGCNSGKPEKSVEVHNTVATTTEATTTAELKKYMITCAELAYKTVQDHKADIPNVMEVTDEVMLSDVMQYDMKLADDSCAYMHMISTELFELTIIKPVEGKEQAVKDMLDARQKYLREQAAFYPSQVAAAEASLTGSINGVYYLICCEKASDLEKTLMYYVLRN